MDGPPLVDRRVGRFDGLSVCVQRRLFNAYPTYSEENGEGGPTYSVYLTGSLTGPYPSEVNVDGKDARRDRPARTAKTCTE